MPEIKSDHVTMRVKVGPNEFEVTGPVEFVERKIEEFLSRQSEIAGVNPSLPGHAGTLDQEKKQWEQKSMSVAQFFKKISPRTDVDRTLAAGFYVEYMKKEAKFTAAEVRETIREAKIPPPKNPSDAVAQNIKKGLVMAAGDKDGKLAYVVTTDGEEFINSLLQN